MMRQLYIRCKEISYEDTSYLLENVDSKEEKDFIRTVSDFVLQQKQKQVIAEKRF